VAESKLRYELKMVCAPVWLAQARTWIRLHPAGFRQAYPPRLVNNLYLDTPHLNSFNANRVGVSTRQKLRLRWYGKTDGASTNKPILELKSKENLLGDKKQQVLDCVLDWKRPYAHILQTIRDHAGTEWQQWLLTITRPTLINRYQREYYISADGTMRATLDFNQVAFGQRLARHPNFQRQLYLPDLVVIELKAVPEHSEQLQAAMAHFPIPRSRNSKYVNGILATPL
jgi:hypothetical protein